MKTLLSLVALLLCISLYAQIPEAPQGEGTQENPFQISNFGNLYWLTLNNSAWNKHTIQTADIDAGDSALISSSEPNTSGWIPIGHTSPFFTGTYDGQGYSIYNLVMHRPSQQYAGLFGYMNGAKLNRVNLRNVSITGHNYSGGLAGVANFGSVVNNCSTTGSVNGVTNVGGLLGYSDGSVITNCYSHASVYGSGDQIGGFIGLSGWNNSSFFNFCYSTGAVTGNSASYKGGFMGRSSSNTVRNCYWDIQTSGMTTDPLAIGKSTLQMKQQNTYSRWNFSNLWSIEEEVSYPNFDGLVSYSLAADLDIGDLMGSGTHSDPYLIMNADQLNVMRLELNSYYALGADIDLSASVVWNHGMGWESIGNSGSSFTGSFDGRNFTIYGLTISRPIADQQGLFGSADGASITRLTISDCHIVGNNNVGGSVGYSKSSSLDEIRVNGTIVAYSSTGGIAGVADNGYIQRSWSSVNITSYSNYAGGLVGYITSSGSINGTVSNSGSTGMVEGYHNVGGLVGMVPWGYILNSYNHGTVKGTYNVGGLVGTMGWSSPGYISRCFSTGLISPNPGSENVGGFVGRAMNGSILECYWDTQSSGISSSSGSGASGKTTADMILQSTYQRWNFEALWQMGNRDGYPAHRDLSVYALPVSLTTSDLMGFGSPDQPYIIQTIDQLNVMRLAPEASYSLINDLDLSATCVWNGGRGWEPVGTNVTPFTGNFNGGGNELEGLFIEKPDGDNSGLFGYVSGSFIKDIVYSNVSIHSRNSVGAVAGYAEDSRFDIIVLQGTISGNANVGGVAGQIAKSVIQRCKVDVTCWAEAYHAGGIVAYVSSDASFTSVVSTCEASGMIRSYSNTGGLVGFLVYGSLINSSSHASVQGYTQNGGAVGTCGWDNPGTLVRCYSTGLIVTEPGGYGNNGLVGRFQNGKIYDCYWDTETSGTTNGGPTDAIGLSNAAMKQRDSYQNWNFDKLWQISEGTDYPRMRNLSIYQDPIPIALNELMGSGTTEDPYLIQNANELSAIRQDLNAHYQILNEIDMSATLVWNAGCGWLPLGTESQPFTGSLNGGGNSVAALSIMAPLSDNVGFFGVAQSASICDVTLQNVSLVGNSKAGGVAGYGSECTINGVSVNGYFTGFGYVGGLVGFVSGGNIHSSMADVEIKASSSVIGGLIGNVSNNATISSCFSSGKVFGYTSLGGLVGELNHGILIDSYSHASVLGTRTLGGAVGRIGWNEAGSIQRCYATGSVSLTPGGYDAGGLIGQLYYGTITDCYWDINTSGMTFSSGYGASGLTNAQITYPGALEYFSTWNFTDTWRHDSSFGQNNGYPYLAWQETPIPDAVQNLIIFVDDGQLILQWQPVAGVARYHIYSSEAPNVPWAQWVYTGQTSSTSYPVSREARRFFMVRSVVD